MGSRVYTYHHKALVEGLYWQAHYRNVFDDILFTIFRSLIKLVDWHVYQWSSIREDVYKEEIAMYITIKQGKTIQRTARPKYWSNTTVSTMFTLQASRRVPWTVLLLFMKIIQIQNYGYLNLQKTANQYFNTSRSLKTLVNL